MKNTYFSIILGGFLGIFDGLSALISAPDTRSAILGIVIGSTIKGIVAGLAIGLFSRRVRSVPLGVAFGLTVGLLLAWPIAYLNAQAGKDYYWQIMVPGAMLGTIVGFATQRHGEGSVSRQVAL